eukprot:scaffold7805_cov116-Isochrysis_galbana.AAC.10
MSSRRVARITSHTTRFTTTPHEPYHLSSCCLWGKGAARCRCRFPKTLDDVEAFRVRDGLEQLRLELLLGFVFG